MHFRECQSGREELAALAKYNFRPLPLGALVIIIIKVTKYALRAVHGIRIGPK